MQVNINNYEGGILDAKQPPLIIPANVIAPAAQPVAIQLPPLNLLRIKLTLPNVALAVGRVIQGVG